jgi:hypothetical protein
LQNIERSYKAVSLDEQIKAKRDSYTAENIQAFIEAYTATGADPAVAARKLTEYKSKGYDLNDVLAGRTEAPKSLDFSMTDQATALGQRDKARIKAIVASERIPGVSEVADFARQVIPGAARSIAGAYRGQGTSTPKGFIENKAQDWINIADKIQTEASDLGANSTWLSAGASTGYSLATILPAAVGGPLGWSTSAAMMYRSTENQFVGDLRKSYEDVNGPISDKKWDGLTTLVQSQIRNNSLWETVPELASDKLFFGILGKTFGKKAVGNLMGRVLTGYGLTNVNESISETITQMGQTNAQSEANTTLGVPGGPTVRDWTNVHDWVQSYKEVAPAVAIQTAFMLGAGGIVNKGEQQVRKFIGDSNAVKAMVESSRYEASLKAEATHSAMQDLTFQAQENALLKRSPESFHEFVTTMTEDGKLPEVYVAGKTLDTALADAGITLSKLQETLPEVATQLKEAVATNGLVRIPTADYLTHIASTKAGEVLLPELRTTPEGATYSEAQQFYQTQQEDFAKQVETIAAKNADVITREEFDALKAEQEQLLANQQAMQPAATPELQIDENAMAQQAVTPSAAATAPQASAPTPQATLPATYEEYVAQHANQRAVYEADVKAVEDNIKGQFKSTGRFTPSVNAAYTTPLVEFYKTQAKMQGISPRAMYEKLPFKVQKFLSGEPSQTLSQGEAATLDDFRKENVKDILTKSNWVILTAENPGAKELSPEENAARMEQLVTQLEQSGTAYYIVDGHYGRPEKSVILFGTTPEQALALGRQYDQESVLTRDGYIYQDGSRTPTTGEVDVYDTAPEDYFTTVTLPDGSKSMFTIGLDFDTRLQPGEVYVPVGNIGTIPAAEVNQGGKVGQVAIKGVHYSNQQRPFLTGATYGTGAKGAEAERLHGSKDSRIKHRIYFYVDEGKGVFPEYGVGNFPHTVTMTNMYDGARNPQRFPSKDANGMRDMNVFESAVIDAGFDGYYIEGGFGRQGVAVMLGDATRTVKPDSELKQSAKEINAHLEAKLKDHEAAKAEYATRPDSLNGKVLNTDVARELSLHYLQNRTLSAEVHDAASGFIKKLYAERLQEKPKEGELPVVLFTAGGTGAGKTSTVLQANPETINKAQIVYDTNLSTYETSKQKVQQALDAGKAVEIVLTVREPVDGLVNGALKRAMRQEQEHGTGRTVPIVNHASTYMGAPETVQKLAEDFKDNPLVRVTVFDNSFGKGNAVEINVAHANKYVYNSQEELEDKLITALRSEYEKGKISVTVARATAVTSRGDESHRVVPQGTGQGATEGAQQSELAQTARALPKVRKFGEEIVAAFKDIAEAEGTTVYPKVNASTFKATVEGMHPDTKNLEIKAPRQIGNGRTRVEMVNKVTGHSAYVVDNGKGEIWVDLSELKSKKDLGSVFYAAAADYAFYNDKVFIGDPVGLSDVALFRRTENMLAIALKYGTTKHIAPHLKQTDPYMYADQYGSGKFTEDAQALRWKEGDDDFNIASLAITGYTNLTKLFPEVKDAAWNPETGNFEWSDGRPFDADSVAKHSTVRALKENGYGDLVSRTQDVGGGTSESSPIGGRTLRRGLITQTILQGQSAEERGTIFAALSERVRRPGVSAGVDADFSGLLFQNTLGSFNVDTLTVTLLSGANFSTVIHESGHFYLKALETMAREANAPQQVVDDYQKALDWFGVTKNAWETMTLDQQRPYHEQWAESFERWNLEGKAPTLQLQPVFSRFRAWLLSVYKSMEQFLELNPGAGKLNDEVRGIFSRLLASQEAIDATEKARGYQPLFATAEAAGVSQKAFDEYLALGQDATRRGVDELQARSMRDMKWVSNARNKAIKELQAQADAQRSAIKTEVTAEVMAEPANQARSFLRNGEVTDPATGDLIKLDKGYKLDTTALKEMYPEGALDTPDLTALRGMTSSEGLSPDIIANMFGFGSGDALVRTLLVEESAKDKIEGLTDQRMLEEHGDLIDQRSIERAADEAIHNEARAKFMATGLRMMTKSAITPTQMAKAAKEAADNAIARKKVRDIKPNQYTAAESHNGKEVIKLLPTDPTGAATAQRAALLNNRLATAATDALNEVDKALKYLTKFNKDTIRKNIDIEYTEQIDALLEPFDLRKGLSLTTIDTRATLADWIAQQEAMGFEPTIDAEAMAAARQKSYKNMTMEEVRALVDTIKQIEHMGRMKKKLLTAQDKADFAARIAEAKASIALNAGKTVTEHATPTDAFGIFGRWVRQMAAAHRKFASYMRELDGGRDDGVMFRLLMQPASEAANRETDMRGTATEEVAKLFTPIMKPLSKSYILGNLYAMKKVVPGTDISMTHEQRIMFGMNWGNEGNRQRLLDGGLEGRKAITNAEAQAILDTLTKDEWDFIQGTWDYIGTYKPLIEAQERELTGKTPEWVEPSPVETKYGTYAGGYFPAKYDRALSTRSDAFEALADLRMAMKGTFGSSVARNGYAKARAEAVKGRPILLSFSTIQTHLNEVIHRVAWQPWLIDAGRVVRALDGDIRLHLGAEALAEISKMKDDIATGEAQANGPVEIGLNRLRTGTTIVGLGWKLSTALLQPIGLSNSWAQIGTRHIAKGVAAYIANPIDSAAWVVENSTFMKNRAKTMNRNLNEILNTIRVGKKQTAVQESFFYLIGKMQRIVDIPTYLGAYDQSLEQQHYELAANDEERRAIEKQAHAVAEQAVKNTQGGGEMLDLAGVQRGSPLLKLFTNFYSYMNMVYNMNVNAFRGTNFKSPSEVGIFAADMLLINIVPAALAVIMKNIIRDNCEWDDPECIAQKYISEQTSYLAGQLVGMRELTGAIDAATGATVYGYQGPAGMRFFSDITKLSQQAAQGEADLALFKAANNVGGSLFHYPAGQINNTVDGLVAINAGEVEGWGAVQALISGSPK